MSTIKLLWFACCYVQEMCCEINTNQACTLCKNLACLIITVSILLPIEMDTPSNDMEKGLRFGQILASCPLGIGCTKQGWSPAPPTVRTISQNGCTIRAYIVVFFFSLASNNGFCLMYFQISFTMTGRKPAFLHLHLHVHLILFQLHCLHCLDLQCSTTCASANANRSYNWSCRHHRTSQNINAIEIWSEKKLLHSRQAYFIYIFALIDKHLQSLWLVCLCHVAPISTPAKKSHD